MDIAVSLYTHGWLQGLLIEGMSNELTTRAIARRLTKGTTNTNQ